MLPLQKYLNRCFWLRIIVFLLKKKTERIGKEAAFCLPVPEFFDVYIDVPFSRSDNGWSLRRMNMTFHVHFVANVYH